MVILGADHGGFMLKNMLKDYFNINNIEYIDVTDYDICNDDDYPDIAKLICDKIDNNKGIAICGSGIGISIACNKFIGIRAANCYDEYTATMARRDNDINVLCLGGRIEYKDIYKIVDIFLNENFSGNRHLRRINKIKDIEDSRYRV